MTGITHTNEHAGYRPFDHERAGLLHLVDLCRRKIGALKREIADVDRQMAAVVREFHHLASIHEVEYHSLPGYESITFHLDEEAGRARHYFWGAFGGIFIAIVLGTYFSITTMVAASPLLLFFGSVAVAVVVGIFASIILRALLGAHADNPHAPHRVNVTLVVVGVAFFVQLAFFAWLRFKSHSPLASLLPNVMVGLELTAIVFAGACECGYRLHRWAEALDNKHRHLSNHKATLEDHLANEDVALQELSYRLDQHEHYAPSQAAGEEHHEQHEHEVHV
jgi:hypothetical protein